MSVVYVVVKDTGGAHEPYGAWSVWETVDAAIAEGRRLNAVERPVKYGEPYGGILADTIIGSPDGPSAFFVVAVPLNQPLDNLGL